MEKMRIIMCGWLMLFASGLFAQSATISIKDTQNPMVVWLSENKTTNFVFPYGVKSVDKGSKDILVQKAGAVENVLQAKAGKPGFTETNLTVITADGQIYSFILKYALQPPLMNIRFESRGIEKPVVQFSEETDNKGLMGQTAEKVAARFPSMKVKDCKFSVLFQLSGIYIVQDVFYFQIRLENSSNVNYKIDQLRFFIHDSKQSKRTASQEIELKPVHTSGNQHIINEHSEQTVVIAIPKFTIPDQKEMTAQLQEANGGRHLKIVVKNRQLLKAQPL